MIQERTELEWVYEPTDYFEIAYITSGSGYDLRIQDGKVTATLHTACFPINHTLSEAIKKHIQGVFQGRQLQNHRLFVLKGQTASNFRADGKRDTAVYLETGYLTVTMGTMDTVLTDHTGKIVADSKSERIARDTSMLDLLGPKISKFPVLRSLTESYLGAIANPSNELAHLFDIREAIAKECGGKLQAGKALMIDRKDWERDWVRLGELANNPEIEQGRHRGRMPTNRRSATTNELNEARTIVKNWIVAFAQTL